MEKIIQLRESEYNELYRVASLNKKEISDEAKKKWEKDGVALIEINICAERDLNDRFTIKCNPFLYGSSTGEFVIAEDVRQRFRNIIKNQVADSIECRFGNAIKTVNEYNKRIRSLDMLKLALYLIAFSGWVSFVIALICK